MLINDQYEKAVRKTCIVLIIRNINSVDQNSMVMPQEDIQINGTDKLFLKQVTAWTIHHLNNETAVTDDHCGKNEKHYCFVSYTKIVYNGWLK